jgi:hypothetical protein
MKLKHGKYVGALALLLMTLATPSTLLAQSWWEGFGNSVQSNAFWDWLQQNPDINGVLQQNPYQIYNPEWRSKFPPLQQYVNNNPGWWNSVRGNGAQYYDAPFTRFLNNHPQIARDLRRNPELIYDPAYLAKHQQLKAFVASHKRMFQTPRNQQYAYSPRGGWGAYNNRGEYRDETWWKANGDWDRQNQWRDRTWWTQNNPAYVQQHHPNWLAQSTQQQKYPKSRQPQPYPGGPGQPR